MKLGRVIGNVVATRKDPGLEGKKLLIIQPVDPGRKPEGKPLLAADATGAGYKETVLYVTAKEAAWPFLPEHTPSDCTIIGIVDDIEYRHPEKLTKEI